MARRAPAYLPPRLRTAFSAWLLLLTVLCLAAPCPAADNATDAPAPADKAARPAAPGKRKIAILEFDAINDEAKKGAKGRMVSEIFTTAAVKSGGFDVVERHLIEKVLSEMEFGKAAVSGTVAQKIGEMVGADSVLSGSVAQYHEELRIDARLVSVRDGKILLADEDFAKDSLQSISEASNRIMAKMLAVLDPTLAKRAQPPAAQAPKTPTPPPAATAPQPAPPAKPQPPATPAPGQGAANIEGDWQTSVGPMRFERRQGAIIGVYPMYSGVLCNGTLNGNILDGFWARPVADVRCASQRCGSYFWGRYRMAFGPGGFQGVYDSCGQGPTGVVTGTR